MGQKVDPRGFRAGLTKSWPAEWFAKSKSQSADFFVEDVQIRDFIEDYYKRTGIGKLVIRKTEKDAEVIVFTAKPALIIGKNGKKLSEFQDLMEKRFGKQFKIVVKEIKNPEKNAKVMAEFACEQLEKRVPYRRVAKSVLQRVMEKGATGVKIQVAGRLGGVELSRKEMFIDGRVPLQTLRSDIDYWYTTAHTKYGILGVKVWIYKGDITTKSQKTKAMDALARKKAIKKATARKPDIKEQDKK